MLIQVMGLSFITHTYVACAHAEGFRGIWDPRELPGVGLSSYSLHTFGVEVPLGISYVSLRAAFRC